MRFSFTRVMFLLMSAGAITSVAYAFLTMLDSNPSESAKALGLAVLLLFGALAAHIERV